MDEVVKELVKVIIHQGKQIHALQESVKALAEDSSKGQELVIGFAAKHLDDIKSYQTFVLGNATKAEPIRRPNVIKTTLDDLNGGSTLTNYEEKMDNLCKTVEDSFEFSGYSVEGGNRNRAESESVISSSRLAIISSPLPSRKQMSPNRRQTTITPSSNNGGNNLPGSPVPDKLSLKGQSSNVLPKGAVSIIEFNELKKEVGSLTSTFEHLRDVLANKAEKVDVETKLFNINAKITAFNDALLMHINTEVERLEGVVLENKEDHDGSMITTKQLCVGCGRRSYTRSSPLDKLPSDAFFPVINSNITPGDDIFRAGFRVPGKKITPTSRTASPCSNDRPKIVIETQNDADECNSLALRDISLNEYSYSEIIPETNSLYLDIGESGLDAIETSRTIHSIQTKATSAISINISAGGSPMREPFDGDIDDEMTEDGHTTNGTKGADLSPLLAVGKTVTIEGSKFPSRSNIDDSYLSVGPYVPNRRGLKTAPAGALHSVASPNEGAKLLRSMHRKGFPKGKIKVSNSELNELLFANTMPILSKK